MTLRAKLLSLVLLAGCATDPGVAGQPDARVAAGPDAPPDPTDNCPPMFAQNILPEYHIEISDTEWAAMDEEFLNRPAREAAGMDIHPYHPVGFSYHVQGAQPVTTSDVLFRLKGQSSWLQAIAFDPDPKMQFVIAFNEINPDARFLGVRKVELDMPRSDHTFLSQRLGLYSLRQGGIPAQCANNAKVFINGAYYGLYTNLERLDKEFLQRNFGHDNDNGDLWESGRIIKTNEDTFSWARLDILWHGVFDVPALEAITDLDGSMQEWAAEAVVGDADGYYNGRANFYIYDHPTRGFLWLATDLDTTLDRDFLPMDASPVFPTCTFRFARDWTHYLLVVNDPVALERYIDALADQRAKYDVANMEARVDQWSAQIADAAAADQKKPFTMEVHQFAVEQTRGYIAPRAEYLDRWLACRDQGGEDVDGDGFDFCHDCNDFDANIHPGAVEVCNGVDDDCNGRIDDLEGGGTCE